MELKCPICGKAYDIVGTDLICDKCRYTIRDSRHVIVQEITPRYIRDSVQLMQRVLGGQVLLSYGPHQLFDPEFNLLDTTIIPIDANCIGSYVHGDMKVLISLGKAFSKFYVQDVFNGVSLCSQVNPTLRDTQFSGVSILQWACYDKKKLTAAEEQALSAYVAPTWFDVANILLYRSYKSITEMTESEVFYNVLSCNKVAVVQDFRSPLGIVDKLAKHIIHLSKFCNVDTSKVCVPIPGVNSFLLGDNFHRAIAAMQESLPDLYTTNSGSNFNNFLFGTSEFLTVDNPLLRDINTMEKLMHLENNAKLFKELWLTFGVVSSTASKESYIHEVAATSKFVPPTMTDIVLTYWNIISKKLEAKYE